MTALERQMAADAIALSKEHADRADAAEGKWNQLRIAVEDGRARRLKMARQHQQEGRSTHAARLGDAAATLRQVLDFMDEMEKPATAPVPTSPAKPPALTSRHVFDVLCDAGFTPRGDGEPGFTTGWYMDAITVDHVGADLPMHGPLEGPRAIIADYAQTLFAAGFDAHITVNTVYVRKRAAKTATAVEEERSDRIR